MKWSTITKYVDLETGEYLYKERVEKEYIIHSKKVYYERKKRPDSDICYRHITYICIRDRQLKIRYPTRKR